MDPYRSAGTACPNCPDVSLREFGHRLVCDNCRGLLMDETDLASACADQRGHDVQLEFVDEQPTQKACPRCQQAMTSCHLSVDKLRTKTAILRCAQHGVWLSTDLLASVFARLGGGTRGRVERSGGPPGWGAGGLSLPGGGGAVTAGLRIGQWDRPRRRTPTVTPINVYSDRALSCPACKSAQLQFQADRWTCPRCTGTFLQNAAFEALVEDISHTQWTMPLPQGTAGERTCPVCTEPMIVEAREGVTIDRCGDHGLWFDARELMLALEHASHQFEEHGLRAWLHRFLR